MIVNWFIFQMKYLEFADANKFFWSNLKKGIHDAKNVQNLLTRVSVKMSVALHVRILYFQVLKRNRKRNWCGLWFIVKIWTFSFIDLQFCFWFSKSYSTYKNLVFCIDIISCTLTDEHLKKVENLECMK